VEANHIMSSVGCVGTGVRGFCNGILKRTEETLEVIGLSRSIFYIKVATGCLGKCSFCAARISRGTIHSKSVNEILYEFKQGLNRGYRYFALLGTDVGAYGRDKGHTLADLLDEMTKERANCRIGLRNVNPYYLNEMFTELKPFFSSGKIWFLGTPVESGSDRILELMGRKYKIEDFRRCIQAINNDYPSIILRTQIMVGFPTETRHDFEKSLQLLVDMTFDWVEIYKFSRRPGTVASTLDGQVSEEIKDCRFRELELLGEKLMIKHSLKNFNRNARKIGPALLCSDLILRTLLTLSRWRAYHRPPRSRNAQVPHLSR